MTSIVTAAGYFVFAALLTIAAAALSEWRFNRRVDQITVGQVIHLPPRLRVVEPEPDFEPLPVELANVIQLRPVRGGGEAA